MPIQAVTQEAAARDPRNKERRQEVRRAHDKRRAAIEALGEWMGGQQPRPLLLLSDTLALIYWNEAAAKALKQPGWNLAQELSQVLKHWSKPPAASVRLTSGVRTLSVTALQARHPYSRIFAIEILQTAQHGATHKVLQESFGLTKSEAQIALSIYNGASRRSAATERGISLDTVKTHLTRIFRKLQVNSQRTLIRKISEMLTAAATSPR